MCNVPDILKKIVKTKQEEIESYKNKLKEFQDRAKETAPALDFLKALSKPGLNVIAEIKKASPSAGIIAADFEPVKIAQAYQNGDADAISILTDEQYFKGSIDFIKDVRPEVNIPILRKDFIIHPIQIFEARAYGADSFLLIAAILSVTEIQEFINLGRSLKMEPLVEVHDREELDKVLAANAQIIGVNNRNLHTFEVKLQTSEDLFPHIPQNAVKVAESGIFTSEDTKKLRKTGFNAILVGQSLMETGLDKVGEKIANFKG